MWKSLAAVVAPAFAFVAAAPAAPAEAPSAMRFIQYNMCGNLCWEPWESGNPFPGIDTRGEVGVRTARFVVAVDSDRPDLVFLNETCYSQYRAIRAALLDRGYHGAYSSTTAGAHCDDYDTEHGEGFGNALFSKGKVPSAPQTYDLGGAHHASDGTLRTYQMLCADASLRGRTAKACVTHLRADSPADRAEQAAAVARKANTWAGQQPTVVGGDFNAGPRDAVPARIYDHGGGTGAFQEADESDPAHSATWTAGAARGRGREPSFLEAKKIDYLFLSAPHFRRVAGDVTSRFPNPTSDHGLYRGQAEWER